MLKAWKYGLPKDCTKTGRLDLEQFKDFCKKIGYAGSPGYLCAALHA